MYNHLYNYFALFIIISIGSKFCSFSFLLLGFQPSDLVGADYSGKKLRHYGESQFEEATVKWKMKSLGSDGISERRGNSQSVHGTVTNVSMAQTFFF